MKIRYSFIILLVVVFSCNNKSKQIENDLSHLIGKKVELIDTLNYYSLNSGMYREDSLSDLKIVSYINGSCSGCLYSLSNWDELMEAEKFRNVSFRLYVKTTNLKQLDYILREIKFHNSIVLDFKNQFFELNKLREEIIYQTFLINKENKILLVGNPILSERIRKLYSETISKEMGN